jgi:hypothetical protein
MSDLDSDRSDDDLDEAVLARPGSSGKRKLLIGLVVVGLLAIIMGPPIVRGLREDAVLAKGTSAPAVVVSLSETGNLYNEVPELRIVVEVRPASSEPWRAEVREFVAAHDTPKIQPGTEISVKYDPEQPSRVAIVEPKL